MSTHLDPGLCGTCQHVKCTRTRRGSVFYLCLLSRTDPSFRQYPPLPVLRCPGYEPQTASTSSDVVPDSRTPP